MPKCCGEVILNTANGKEFYYCRECKKEVLDIQLPTLEDPPKQDKFISAEEWEKMLDDYYADLLANGSDLKVKFDVSSTDDMSLIFHLDLCTKPNEGDKEIWDEVFKTMKGI